MVAASIRSNNPGAMWGNPIAKKWGATKSEVLNDGLNQGNNIAYFPTKLMGACAQMDLWRTHYTGMTFAAADKKWSGGNSDHAYVAFLCQHVPGLTPDTIITQAFLRSANGWIMMKYQAQWEAGQVYPGMSDADWQKAQQLVFDSQAPVTARQKKVASSTAIIVGAGTAAKAAHTSGAHWGVVVAIVIAGVVCAIGVWLWIHRSHASAGVASPIPNPDRGPPLPSSPPPLPNVVTGGLK